MGWKRYYYSCFSSWIRSCHIWYDEWCRIVGKWPRSILLYSRMAIRTNTNYIAYTDGSYQSSIGAGGWSSIILDENENIVARLYQGMKDTTNNRMELKGVLETLKYFDSPTNIHIVSDSMYVVGSITSGSAKKWIEENDLTKKNLDLWFQIVDLLEKHNVTFEWTKGHVGNKWNEEADKWCTFAAQCINLPKDVWTTHSKQKD